MKAGIFMLIGSLLIIIPTLSIQAQIPRTLSYQGILTDDSGTPLSDGQYTMLFALYNSAIGGTAIWSETKSLQLSGGLFSTYLGDQTEFGNDIQFNQPYWVGITVGAGPEMTDRIPLTSVGYSFRALKADSAESIVSNANLNILSVSARNNGAAVPGDFRNENISSATKVLNVQQFGTGKAAVFSIANSSSTEPTIYAVNGGSGHVAHFEGNVYTSTIYLGPKILSTNNGDGIAGDFRNLNLTNESYALNIRHDGLGKAAVFSVNNSSSTQSTIYAVNGGSGYTGEFMGDVFVLGTLTEGSDKRWKKNIKSIKGALNSVLKIRGVSFEWDLDKYPDMGFKDRPQIGFIAQELEEMIPELVRTDNEGYKSIDYARVNVLLVEALKEQQSLINDLSGRIKRLEENLSNHALVKMDAETFKSSNEGLE